MNFRLVFKLTGKTLLVEAGALLLPLLVCLFYRENPLPPVHCHDGSLSLIHI